MKSNVPISEAVWLLGNFAPAELELLRERAPSELRPHLELGGVAGSSDTLLKGRAEVVKAALEEVERKCREATDSAERRLKISRYVRLVGEIAAIVGSASVLGSAGDAGSAVLIPSGIVALIGALSATIADFVLKLPHETGRSLFETYAKLGRLSFEARSLVRELDIFLTLEQIEEKHESELRQLIVSGNTLCGGAYDFIPLLLDVAKAQSPVQIGGRRIGGSVSQAVMSPSDLKNQVPVVHDR